MRRIPASLLRQMATQLSGEDRDEMAIPSYLHPNPALRWMAWRRVTVIARHLADHVAKRPATAIMDFGCGTGVLLGECARHAPKVWGVDLVLDAARLLKREWSLDSVTLLTPDEAEERVEPGSLDVILGAEVLEHVEPLDETLQLFKSWLKPDGRLVVSLPTENHVYRLGRRLAGFSGHYHHANAASIDREIRAAGFRRDRLETVPLPGPLSVYWVLGYSK